AGVLLSPAHTRRRAVGRGGRARFCRDRDHLGIGAKLEISGHEFVRRAPVLEEDDLAISLTARLKPDACLRPARIADLPAVDEDLAFASRAADDEGALAYGRKNGVAVAVTKEPAAFSSVPEQRDGVLGLHGIVRPRGGECDRQ